MLFRGRQREEDEDEDPSSSSTTSSTSALARQRRPQQLQQKSQAESEDTFEVPPIPAGGGGAGGHFHQDGEPHRRHFGHDGYSRSHSHSHPSSQVGGQQHQLHNNAAAVSSRQRFGMLRGHVPRGGGDTMGMTGSSSSGRSRSSGRSGSGGVLSTALPTQHLHSRGAASISTVSRYGGGGGSGSSGRRRINLKTIRGKWTRLSRYQQLAWAAFASLLVSTSVLQVHYHIRGRRRAQRAILAAQEERKRRMLGLGHRRRRKGIGSEDDRDILEKRGVVPWDLADTGRDPSRDRLVEWWLDHPDAPVGLSCAVFATTSLADDDGDGDGDDDSIGGGGGGGGDGINSGNDGTDESDESEIGDRERKEKVGGGTTSSIKRSLAVPTAPAARSTASASTTTTLMTIDDTYFYKGYGISPPIFKGRMPETGSQRVQVAFVLPFVEFQLNKVATLLTEHWGKFPPCHANSPRQSADLVFFTENKLSASIQRRIRSVYSELGPSKTGCFRTDEPMFLSMAEVDPKLSHLEGAAFTFFSLFRLLEKSYKTFILAEPDVAPVQPNFLPALVMKTLSVNCESDGFWQLGSLPLARDVDAGMLRERLDYHMNGNAIYVLGCPEFEEYKCRVQTFYVPKDDCELVAGCSTHEAYEGGYDHALYRYRMHPENYEYSRLILHKFGYSDFIQNRGEGVYVPAEVVEQSPSTYFVHSKSIYQNVAATTLKEVTVSVLKRDPCNRDSATEKALEKIYHYLRSGEYTKADAIRDLCDASKYKLFGPQPSARLCEMYAGPDSALKAQNWESRMPGKTYLWTMDFHGGPTNCDMSMITKAGGAIHAEIDGICDFYGLCKDRLKVIKADNWKEFDPTERQRRDFQMAYEADPEFKRVDAFICHHPVANCELFLPFNRSIIIHATTRLEFGRHDEGIDWRLSSGYDRDVGKEKWKKWVRTIQKLALDTRNVIAANNAYDRDYIKYFTGVENVELLPSWCGDNVGTSFCQDGWESSVSQGWLPTRPEVVIVPYRSNLDRTRYKTSIRDPIDHPIIKELAAVPKAISNGTDVRMIRELYSDANPLRMLKHPAIIILPYQISTMQLIELYRLNIPTFCPSLSLLKRWCREHDLMWEVHYGWPENLMNVKDIPNPNGHALMDKYSKEWEEMFDHWIPKSDFYQLDHITYFDSWEHFHRQYKIMVQTGELEKINRQMTFTNAQLRDDLVEKWKVILQRVKRH